MRADVIVVGAGIAGLQCARDLARSGAEVVVLERARGVGGRCATRRVDDQAVDFGLLFLHGHDRAFLDAVAEVEDAEPLVGWPQRVHGSGTPCQPDAFAPYERRIAFADGISVFAKHLARGLNVRVNTEVSELAVEGAEVLVSCRGGEQWRAPRLVLALALEQSRALLRDLPDEEQTRSGTALLGMFASLPCLTLIAGYPLDCPEPPWDLSYPSDSDILMAISNESSKRPASTLRLLVYQARPRWSRQHLEAPVEVWQEALLQAAAGQLGTWAAAPSFTHAHSWRFGRIDQCSELASPLLIDLNGGAQVGLTGDIFAAGGGAQAAWLAGDSLARRIREGMDT